MIFVNTQVHGSKVHGSRFMVSRFALFSIAIISCIAEYISLTKTTGNTEKKYLIIFLISVTL